MAAVQVLIHTVELLELIVLQLPPHQMPHLRLVSTYWRNVVEQSTAIRRHYRNRPLIPTSWDGLPSSNTMPIYESNANIKPHPAFQPTIDVGCDDSRKIIRLTFSYAELQELNKARTEFATKPPCQYIALGWGSTSIPERVMFVELGVTVGDLIEQRQQYYERLALYHAFNFSRRGLEKGTYHAMLMEDGPRV
jgi:hypothetical protein